MSDSDNTTRIVSDLLKLLNTPTHVIEKEQWMKRLRELDIHVMGMKCALVASSLAFTFLSVACYCIFTYVTSEWFWIGFCSTFWLVLFALICTLAFAIDVVVDTAEVELIRRNLVDTALEEI